MDLRDYLSIVRKRWLMIVAIMGAAIAVALGVSAVVPPSYSASTQLYVSVQGGTTTSDMLQGANFTRQQVSSYTRLVSSPLVLKPVIDDLGLGVRTEALASQMSADSPLNSSLINISMRHESPAMAAAIANAVAEEFRDVVSELEKPVDGGPSTVKLTVVKDAVAPESPSQPNTKLNLALGLLVGLVLGVGVAVLREVLDTRVHDESVVAQVTDAAVIGVIAFEEGANDYPLIVQSDPHSPRAEAFRRLRTNIQFLEFGERPSSFVITSSLPGEGKSTTTINLAIALADAGTRVALVDADLRRPSVARYLGLEGEVGLTTVLIGKATVSDVIQQWGNGNLNVLPSGQIPPNPSELLGSKAMSSLLEELVASHDVVLIDTPPLLPVTDAALLAKLTGGAMMVVGAGAVHRAQLQSALGSLATVGAAVLGVVVNREPRRLADTYAYYRYESQPKTSAKRKSFEPKRDSGGPAPKFPSSSTRFATSDSAGAPDGPAPSAAQLPWPEGPGRGVQVESRKTVPQHYRRAR